MGQSHQHSRVEVLIVDDERMVREYLKRLLLTREIECHAVTSVREAIEYLEQCREIDCPRLILLDLIMPQQGGNDLLQWIRDSAAFKPPVVVLSGYVNELRSDLLGIPVAIIEKAQIPVRLLNEILPYLRPGETAGGEGDEGIQG